MTLVATLRQKFLGLMQPVIAWLGRTHLPASHKIVKFENYQDLKNLWRRGDILITHTDGEASDVIIGGFWKHAAMVADDATILEATAIGVHTTNAIDFLLSKDAVALMRVNAANDGDALVALQWAMAQLGKPYDYQLSPDLSAFYCSEVPYHAYTEAMKERFPLKTKEVLEVPVYAPEYFWDDKAHVTCLYDSRAHAYTGVESTTPAA